MTMVSGPSVSMSALNEGESVSKDFLYGSELEGFAEREQREE